MKRVLLTMAMAFLVPVANQAYGQHHTARFFHSWGSPREIHDMAFSPDGQHLAVAIEGGPLTVIEANSGDVAREFKVAPFEISFSADGRQILGLGERETVLMNLQSGAMSNVSWQVPEGYVGCSFKAKSGKLVVDSLWEGGPAIASGKIGKGDELIAIVADGHEYDLLGRSAENVVEPLAGPPGTSVTLRMIPKGKTASVDIEVFRKAATKNGDRFTFREFRGRPSGQVCFCMSNSSFALLDANTGHLSSVFRPIDCNLSGLNAVSSDGRLFAWASRLREPTNDGSSELALEVFDVSTLERTHFATIDARQISGVRFTPDDRRVLIGDLDRIAVYDLHDQSFKEPVLIGFDLYEAEKQWLKENAKGRPSIGPNEPYYDLSSVQSRETLLSSFDVSADGSMVAVGSAYGQCSLYSTTEHKCLATIGDRTEKLAAAEETTLSPDGRWVAYFVEGTLNIVSVQELIAVPENAEDDLASQE